MKDINYFLGRGQNGSVVVKGQSLYTRKPVAIKIIKKNLFSKQDMDKFQKKVGLYQMIQHPNVVELLDVFETIDCLFLVMELHQTFSFKEYWGSIFKDVNELNVREFILQLGSALNFIHESGVILRNLDLNSLLMSENTTKGVAVNATVRLNRINEAMVRGFHSEHHSGINNNICFCAPEVVQGKRYHFKADSWSFGVIIFFMFTNQLPFSPTAFPDTPINDQILLKSPNYNLILNRGFSQKCVSLV